MNGPMKAKSDALRKNAGKRKTKARERQTQAERSDQAISALREAALEMILEKGYAGLNLAEVGMRAGYSRGIVSYHYGTKEALLADLIERAQENGRQAFWSFDQPGLKGIDQSVRAIEAEVARAPSAVLATILLINEASGSMSPAIQELGEAYNRSTRANMEAKLRQSVAALRRLDLTPETAAILFLAVVRGINQQWLAGRDGFDILGALRAFRQSLSLLIAMEEQDEAPESAS